MTVLRNILKQNVTTQSIYKGTTILHTHRESTGESGPVKEKGKESTERLNESCDFSKRRRDVKI